VDRSRGPGRLGGRPGGRLFNAKKDADDGGGPQLDRLVGEISDRLALAASTTGNPGTVLLRVFAGKGGAVLDSADGAEVPFGHQAEPCPQGRKTVIKAAV
jgi:hypothetical protein